MLGLRTNQYFLKKVLESEAFNDSSYNTRWLTEWWNSNIAITYFRIHMKDNFKLSPQH